VKLLSDQPQLRAFERLVLLYSPLWIGAVAAVMLSGALAHWRDPEHLMFGVGLALPVLLPPFLPAALDLEREQPAERRYATRAVLYLAITTFVQMYLGSWLFFDRLGMQYHFHTSWEWNRSPVFLYPMTLAYFATYYVAMQVAVRALAVPAAGPRRWLLLALLSYVVAFCETAFMATPAMTEFFFYRDKSYMLLYGSFCYGTVFFATLPGFLALDQPSSLGRVAFRALLGNAIALAAYGVYARLLPQ
jgi:cycloeucalenol cycloisomerase